MEITKITLRKVDSDKAPNLRAFAQVELDGELVLTGIKVMHSERGLFIGMPSQLGKDSEGNDKYYDIFFPVSKEFRAYLQQEILKDYSEAAEPEKPKGRPRK